ncbi:Bax inhibitor-1/YccA family protein [bacterium]|nr:Bax inhibitor-1/YccA family protein [bacterium]
MQYPEYPYPQEASVSNFMYKVYAWMSCALAVTAGIAYYVFESKLFFTYLMTHSWAMILLIILQFALVIAIAFFIMRMSLFMAITAFITYAASVGVTMASVFFVYTKTSIASTFLITAGMFLGIALYGYFTKTDLSSVGSFAIMGLWGLILGGVVNIFLRSSGFDFILSIAGVLIFTLLTAYDTQKIKKIASRLVVDNKTRGKIAIYGALTLYLDFINLFLYMLRFMGNRREN